MQIQVIAHPNSKRPRVLQDSSGLFHVYISQPAHEGKANLAVIKSLAAYFKIAKSKIFLARGEKSRQKVFDVNV